MKILDESRPYGTICGGNTRARYEQDGLLFDTHGNEITDGSEDQKIKIDSYFEIPKNSPTAGTPDFETQHPEPEPPEEGRSDEEWVLELFRTGKTKKEIRHITGLHYKTIGKILKNAPSEDGGGLG